MRKARLCIMSGLRGAECELHTSANKKGKYIQRGIALSVRVQSQIRVLGKKPPWLGQDEEVQQTIGKAEIAAKMEGLCMTELERRAMLGDRKAQEECTRRGIAIPCPKCGSEWTQVRHMGWGRPSAFNTGYRVECTDCLVVNGAHKTEKEALADWNTRPAPPIGRCKDCANWYKGHCAHGQCAAEPTDADFFCGNFEPMEATNDQS